MGRKKNPGENFLSRAHKIHPPKLGGKGWRESALTTLLQKFSLPTSTKTQRDIIRRRKQKITTQLPNPAPPPNTATQHRKLTQNQQKINPKSTEKQLENPTQNQDKPSGKPNSKSIKTHGETQPKIITDTPQNHQNRSKSRSKFIKPIYKFI